MSITQLPVTQLHQFLEKGSALLLDVRDINEFEYCQIEDSINIPLSLLPLRLNEIRKDLPIVIICHHGVRSFQACHFLEQMEYENLYNLAGGIDAWSLYCDPKTPRY
jgi:rhodanese-related sulfurtransferase